MFSAFSQHLQWLFVAFPSSRICVSNIFWAAFTKNNFRLMFFFLDTICEVASSIFFYLSFFSLVLHRARFLKQNFFFLKFPSKYTLQNIMCYIIPMPAWTLDSLRWMSFPSLSTIISMWAAQTRVDTEILPVLLRLPLLPFLYSDGGIYSIDTGELYHCMRMYYFQWFMVFPVLSLSWKDLGIFLIELIFSLFFFFKYG